MKIATKNKNQRLWVLLAIGFFLLLYIMSFTKEAEASSYYPEPKTGIVSTTALNIRSGPSSSYQSLGILSLNEEVILLGEDFDEKGTLWYQISARGVIGYSSSDFIIVSTEAQYVYDSAFEMSLDAEGFPESYKEYLRKLHAHYPNWIFKSARTGLNWSDVIEKESKVGTSLVSGSSTASWKSMEKGAYSFDSNTYTSFDSGNWVSASKQIIEYYMDPRNFLNEIGIFQFSTHSFDEQSQTLEGLTKILEGTFMAGAFPEEGYLTYADVLLDAGRQANVNPYVLAAMIIVEQGSSGNGGCISGTVSGYEGYYNFFNIGAYKTSTMSAVTRGVWYASQSGSYDRPWNSRAKSIMGGAKFYGMSYVEKNKYTLYFKKFNVLNGLENVGIGQYMTNIQGAESEAAAMRKGYMTVLDSPMVFSIPVYENMPAEPCIKPAGGNNNNYLSKLSVDGYTFTPEFDRYTTEYELIVGENVSNVNISGALSSSGSTAVGFGNVYLEGKDTRAVIEVTSSSGVKREYAITISKSSQGQEQSIAPSISSDSYQFDKNVTGIAIGTDYGTLVKNIRVEKGKILVLDKSGNEVNNGLIGTGMCLKIVDSQGVEIGSYPIIIRGDINGDGKVNSADPLLLQKHIVGSKELKDAYLEAGDVNKDGRINSLDVLYIQKHIVGSFQITS